jgi:hypothetical protein
MSDQERPALPYEALRAAVADDEHARTQLDELHAHVAGDAPDPARIATHVDALRGVRDAEAYLLNWWDDPRTQGWIKSLGDAGL